MYEEEFGDINSRFKDIERYRLVFADIEESVERIDWVVIRQEGEELKEEFKKIYCKSNQVQTQLDFDWESFSNGVIPQDQLEKKMKGLINEQSNIDLELDSLKPKLFRFIDKIDEFVDKSEVVEEKRVIISALKDARKNLLLCEKKLEESREGKKEGKEKGNEMRETRGEVLGEKNFQQERKEETLKDYKSTPFTKIWKNSSSKSMLKVFAILGILLILTIAFYVGSLFPSKAQKIEESNVTEEPPFIKDFYVTSENWSKFPLQVMFISITTGNINSYYWEFEPPTSIDWKSYHAATARHTFKNPGNYTISLTVENKFGAYKLTKKNYINVTSIGSNYRDPSITAQVPLIHNFSATSNRSGQYPLPVTFDSTITGNVSNYYWVFEPPNKDLDLSDIRKAYHTFNNPGIFTVSLTVDNEAGNSTLTRENYIEVKS